MSPKGPVYEKSFEFALLIVELHQKLCHARQYDLARQLLRCGTSVGANVNEAAAAVSKKDFINKMGIASKEARESLFWLRLLSQSKVIEIPVHTEFNLCKELVRILTSIVKTGRESGKL